MNKIERKKIDDLIEKLGDEATELNDNLESLRDATVYAVNEAAIDKNLDLIDELRKI